MENNEGPQLVIVALVDGEWVVDQDSAYVLSEAADEHTVVVLAITGVEALSRG